MSRMRSLQSALDEARFGPGRTLNLRARLPTAAEAAARAEAWLREKQASRAGEVLVITGRGNQSPGGVGVVHERIGRLLVSLRRQGVVRDVAEHTPGSYVVRLAPLSAVREAAPRRRHPAPARTPDPKMLAGLDADTRALLRRVARESLESLGVQDPEPFLEREMVAQFVCVARAIPDGPRREQRLRAALVTLLEEYEDR